MADGKSEEEKVVPCNSTTCNWLKSEIDDLKKTVFGNGGEGLKISLVKLIERHSQTSKNVKEIVWLNRAVVIALIVAMIKIVWGFSK